MSNITAPIFPKLTVTEDHYGSGVTEDGVEYRTWDIYRPATRNTMHTRLASITLYASEDINPVVLDHYLGDGRVGDQKAIQCVRNVLASDYPTAWANSYRFTAV